MRQSNQKENTMTKTCLIVDDVKTSRLTARIHIEQLKFNALEAATIAEAGAAINANTVDFILLDWHLGTESGLDFCRHIKQNKPNIKVIMMSGVEDTESSEEDAKAAGADAFMKKPTTIGNIMECLIQSDIEFIR